MKKFSLEEKHRIEEKFHNNWAKTISIDSLLVRESFEAETAIENRKAMEELGNLKGKKLLDLGCGAGETSVYFSMKGADVYAIDISAGMIERTRKLASKYRVAVKTYKMVSEDLKFKDEFFDFVFGNGVLHHLDIGTAIPEIHRVMKRGGKAVFIEPLGYNPLIWVYRKIAKDVRTETEAPFRYGYLSYMKKYFSSVGHKNFWLSSLLVFVYMFLIEKVDPSSDRYWKRVIRESERYGKLFRILNRIDEILLSIFPFLGRFCWNIMVILKK